jgi:hypothetical protein
MAWLNIDRDLEYDFNEMLVAMCEVPEDEIFYHPLGGFPLEVVNCDMPFKSGMKNNSDCWGYRGSERTKHGLNTWVFMDYIIESNINKSFGNAFRYYCKFVNRQYQKYFLERFQNYNSPVRGWGKKYWIDSNDIIRANPRRFGRWYFKDEQKEISFKSFDYEETWKIQKTSKEIKRNWKKNYSREVVITDIEVKTFRRGISEHYIQGFDNHYPKAFIKAIEMKSKVGHKEIVDSKKSPRYQKLRQEDDRRYKKQEREKERARKEITYSFLTKSEIEQKKSRLEDGYNLYRHGFNDESFKGNPYHGRKNKKK